MEIRLKLYGSSKLLSDKKIFTIKIPKNANIEKLRKILSKIIFQKYLENDLKNLSKTAAFFSEKDEIINDKYKLKNKELISIIPPISGG
jgi:molybdopterin converting factor small subunit